MTAVPFEVPELAHASQCRSPPLSPKADTKVMPLVDTEGEVVEDKEKEGTMTSAADCTNTDNHGTPNHRSVTPVPSKSPAFSHFTSRSPEDAMFAQPRQQKFALMSKLTHSYQHAYQLRLRLLSLFATYINPILAAEKAAVDKQPLSCSSNEKIFYAELESSITQIGSRSLRFFYPRCAAEACDVEKSLRIFKYDWEGFAESVNDSLEASLTQRCHTMEDTVAYHLFQLNSAASLVSSMELIERFNSLQSAIRDAEEWVHWYYFHFPQWDAERRKHAAGGGGGGSYGLSSAPSRQAQLTSSSSASSIGGRLLIPSPEYSLQLLKRKERTGLPHSSTSSSLYSDDDEEEVDFATITSDGSTGSSARNLNTQSLPTSFLTTQCECCPRTAPATPPSCTSSSTRKAAGRFRPEIPSLATSSVVSLYETVQLKREESISLHPAYRWDATVLVAKRRTSDASRLQRRTKLMNNANRSLRSSTATLCKEGAAVAGSHTLSMRCDTPR